jgi:DNA polymerase III delta prime subunit
MNLAYKIWEEKYRPSRVADVILPARIKNKFQQFVNSGEIEGSLLLCGGSGCGKTSIARAVLEEIGAEYMFVNASLNGNIDTLRYEIQDFAVSMSLDGGRKYVILDEGDRLSQATQEALRGFIEEYSISTSFIITCNTKSKIIGAIQSRFDTIDFDFNPSEVSELKTAMFKRMSGLLKTEEVTFDREVVADIINKHFPDFRKIIITLQGAAKAGNGSINAESINKRLEDNFDALMGLIKTRRWIDCKTWLQDNSTVSVPEIFRKMYDTADKYLKESSIPLMIILSAKYQYQAAFVADQEVNLMSYFIECMADLEFL